MCLLTLISVTKSMAERADLFSYDALTIENQMAQLDQLEGYVLANPGVILSEITSGGDALSIIGSDLTGIRLTNEKTLGIPGFCWGCTFGWIGILIVYLNGQDSEQVKKATIGCVVQTLLVGAIYLASGIISGMSY